MSSEIEIDKNRNVRIRFNSPLLPDLYSFEGKEKISPESMGQNILIKEDGQGTTISIPLGLLDHIIGLGEKALPVERRRTRVEFWNFDSYAYNLKSEPLYVSVPFFMVVNKGKAKGYFVNYGGRIKMDFGQSVYDQIIISVPSRDFDFHIFSENTPENVLSEFMKLTGKPFRLPSWVLEHQICRYSYYPDGRVLEIIEKYREIFGKHSVGSVYLDIDYMDEYKPFTVNRERFPDMKAFTDKCHSMGIRVIPIIDPGLKVDQKTGIFKRGLGNYVETSKGELFTADVWPGKCAFPDFLNSSAQEFWTNEVREFMEKGVDGIWLDMNEPSVRSESRTIDEDATHSLGETRIRHGDVHNYYAMFEARATRSALDDDKFILSRSGFAGIQKYAAIWSGDGNGNFESMALQIPLLTSLSISGIPYVGCDLGGFLDYTDPELLLRFYQMALFFPVYRNHKSKTENDQELFLYHKYYIRRFREILALRHSIVPHLLWKARDAEENFSPIIRPMAFNYPENEGMFQINDQYMVGKEIMVAPIVHRNQNTRQVFLPGGRWYNLQTGTVNFGDDVIDSGGDIPVYLKENEVLITENALVFFGKFKGRIFLKGEWINIEYDGKEIKEGKEKMGNTKIIDAERDHFSFRDIIA